MTLFVCGLLLAAIVFPAPAFAACSSPSGSAGNMMYNKDYHVPQYCDGSVWMQMGQKQGAGGSGCSALPAMVTTSGLVGLWKLDDGSGTSAADSSGGGHTGTLINTPAWTTSGNINGALTFNGTSQYVDVPDVAALRISGSWTESIWVKLSSLPTSGNIFTLLAKTDSGGNENYSIRVDNNFGTFGTTAPGSFVLQFSTSGGADEYVVYTPASISLNTWYLVTGVWDSSAGNLYLYVNGSLVATQNTGGAVPTSASGQDFFIGDNPGQTYQYTPGTLDDVRIYNRALSAAEINGIYLNTATPTTTAEGDVIYNADKHVPQFCDGTNWIPMAEGYPTAGLVGYWKLDEGTGTTTADSSGTGNNGTLVAGPTWTTGGKINDALTVAAASSQYVNVPDAASLRLPVWTVSSWVKLTSMPAVGAAGDILDKYGTGWHDYVIAVDNKHDCPTNLAWKVEFQTSGGSGYYTCYYATINTGTWYHVAGTWDGTTMSLYLNGSFVASSVPGLGILPDSGAGYPLALGRDAAASASRYLDGTIDDARVYNRVLSAQEIATLAMKPTAAVCVGASDLTSGLIHRWRLDESPGSTTAADSAGTATLTKTQANGDFASGKINGGFSVPKGGNGQLSVTTPADMLGKSALTISAWVKLAGLGNALTFYQQTANETLGVEITQGTIYFVVADSTYSAGTLPTTAIGTDWHLVTMVFDGTQTGNAARLIGYIDGVQQTLTFTGPNIPATTTTYADTFCIGDCDSNPGGTIDDVRVYNRALSATEVTQLYNYTGYSEGDITYNGNSHAMQYCDGANWQQLGARRSTAAPSTGMVGWWKLDDALTPLASGENAIDILGEFSSPSVDTTADYVKGCPNNGASPFGFNFWNGGNVNSGAVIDATNHRLFVADSGNNRVLVYNLTSGNLISSKTPAYVLGEADFISCNAGGLTQSTMNGPTGLAFDAVNNRLFVMDYNNNRVLVFNTSTITSGMNASYVLGQTNFTSSNNATTQSGLTTAPWNGGSDVALDSVHQLLYVTDNGNNRVMVFNVATGTIANGENATYELGQPSGGTAFTTATAATSQSGLSNPTGVAVDTTNNWLYVADGGNNRVMVFPTSSIANGENATYELGQPSGAGAFTTNGGNTTQSAFVFPTGLAADPANNRLFVTDNNNNRVLVFGTSGISNGENASYVFGQPDFVSGRWGAGTTQALMAGPVDLAYDSTNNQLYVVEQGNNRVTLFNTSTALPAPSSPTQSGADGCTIGNGKLYCWGHNNYGQDGLGNTNGYTMPQQAGTAANWTSVSQGDPHADSAACGLAGGALYCWGDNYYGELGLGTIGTGPVGWWQFDDGGGTVAADNSGYGNNGTLAGTSLPAWTTGMLGGALTFSGDASASHVDMGNPIKLQVTGSLTTTAWIYMTSVNAGDEDDVIINKTNWPTDQAFVFKGSQDCTGVNLQDNLEFTISGSATTGASRCSNTVLQTNTWYFVAGVYNAGTQTIDVYINGVLDNGVLNGAVPSSIHNTAQHLLIGSNSNGTQTFNGKIDDPRVYNRALSAAEVAAIYNGNPDTVYTTPQQVGYATNWTAVSQGGGDACGIAGGALYCWGLNEFGEDGLGNTTRHSTPQQVGALTTWTAISQSTSDACGIAGGKLYCWGYNYYGEDGVGDTTPHHTPQQVGSATNWTAISQGAFDTCGIAGGTLYCWGENQYGELGLGNTTPSSSPLQVGALTTWTAVSIQNNGYNANNGDACGIAGGKLYCWGANGNGELGLGNTMPALLQHNGGGNGGDENITFSDTTTVGSLIVVCDAVLGGNATSYSASDTAGNTFTFVNTAAPNLGYEGCLYAINNAATASDVVTVTTGLGSVTGSIEIAEFSGINASSPLDTEASATGSTTNPSSGPATTTNANDLIIGTSLTGGADTYGAGFTALDIPNGNAAEYEIVSTTGSYSATFVDPGDTWAAEMIAFKASWTGPPPTTPQQVGALTTWTAVSYGWGSTCGIAGSQLYCWGSNDEGQLGIGNTTTPYTTSQAVVLGGINSENASDLLGQYASLSSAATVIWTKNGLNNGPTALGFSRAGSVALDPVNHNLYVSDSDNNRVLVYTLNTDNSIFTSGGGHTASYVLGQQDFVSNGYNTTSSTLGGPSGLAVDTVHGRLFVADPGNNRVMVFSTAGAAPTIDSSLVGWWKLDENTATAAADSSGIGNYLYNDGTTVTGGKFGYARSLGNLGADDLYGANIPNLAQFTVSLWIKTTSLNNTTQTNIISQGSWPNSGFMIIDDGPYAAFVRFRLQYGSYYDASIPRASVNDGNWHLLTATYDGTTQAFYLDGVSQVSQPAAGDYVVDNTDGIYMGSPSTGSAAYDDVRIYNRALSSAEVTQLYTTVVSSGFSGSGLSNGELASYVLGEPDFVTGGYPTPAASQKTLAAPQDVAYDSVNDRLYVADTGNNRVMVFNLASIANGMNASYVLGEPDWVTGQSGGGMTAALMNAPQGVALDSTNNRLFVAEGGNNRVTVFNVASITSGESASYELGQPSGTAWTTNGGTTTQSGLSDPGGLSYDATTSRLFVADGYNGRVMVFNAAPGTIANGENASNLIGHPSGNWTDGSDNVTQWGLTFNSNNTHSGDVKYDPGSGRLFVADNNASRVMVFPSFATGPTTAADSSGNGNTGTLVNGPTWTTGKLGGALSFDGVSKIVTTSTDLIGTGTVTMCAWAYPITSGAGGNGAIVGNTATRLLINANLWAVTSDSATTFASSSASVAYNSWQHVCAVRKSGTNGLATIYVNGVQSGSADQNSGTPFTFPLSAAIGARGADSGGGFFNGTIDDARVYNRALSASEILDLYNTSN